MMFATWSVGQMQMRARRDVRAKRNEREELRG